MSLVSLAKIQRISRVAMRQAISESLDLINYSLKQNIRKIAIKANLCYYWDYSTGQTTDPTFVAALTDLLREKIAHDIEISIVESDASAMECKYAFTMLGYTKLAEDSKVKLVNLSEDPCQTVKIQAGGQSFDVMIPRTIQAANLKINVPKIKYAIRGIELTCALKNIFGCNPYPKKSRYHSRLGPAIVALNKAMKFDLCIIDGNIVSGIGSRKLGLVMASTDPVAIDAAAAKIAGLNPRRIGYIQLACKEGLGTASYVSRGVGLDCFKASYPKKDFRKKLMGRAYTLAVQTGLARRLGLG